MHEVGDWAEDAHFDDSLQFTRVGSRLGRRADHGRGGCPFFQVLDNGEGLGQVAAVVHFEDRHLGEWIAGDVLGRRLLLLAEIDCSFLKIDDSAGFPLFGKIEPNTGRVGGDWKNRRASRGGLLC